MFDFDEGPTGGSNDPFINWHAKETKDGSIAGRNFSTKVGDDKVVITDKFKKGVVFDITSLKTGWCLNTGVAGQVPDWVWNETPARFAAKPSDIGENSFRKGFQIRIALGGGEIGMWSQAGAGAFEGLVGLMKEAKASAEDGKLPLAVFEGGEMLEFKKGSTFYPKFSIKKWVPRPESLDATAEEPAPEPAAKAPAAKPAPAPEPATDDIEEF
jgi:hypothetical protein